MKAVYSNLKVFHYPDKVASLPAEVPDAMPPLHIRLKPTNVCNHNCWYCAYRKPDLQLGQDMRVRDQIPREKMLEILEDLVEMGVKAVTFSGGGEPLVYPHIAMVMERLAEAGIKFASLTNGSRLTGEAARLLSAHGSWVRISLDGWDGPSYARYRGVGDDEFAKVMTNLAEFAALGGPCALGVVYIVDQDNASHVGEVLDRLVAAGVRSIKVSPCITSNDAAVSNRYHDPYRDLVAGQIAAAQDRHPGAEIYNAYQRQLETFDKAYHWCPSCQIQPVIGADLNVYTCQDKAYNLDSGLLFSIKDVRLRQAWLADKRRFFRVDPSRDCRHHCVSDGRNRLLMDYFGLDPDHLAFV